MRVALATFTDLGFSSCERWRELSKHLCKSRTRDHAVPTNMADTFSKFVHHKSCANLLRFRNFYRPNTRPYPYVLDSKEESTQHVGVSSKETDLADRHDHRIGVNQIYYHTYLQTLALFVCTQFPLNLELAIG